MGKTSVKAEPRTTSIKAKARTTSTNARAREGQIAPPGKLCAILWDPTAWDGAGGFVVTDEHSQTQAKATLSDGMLILDDTAKPKSLAWFDGTHYRVGVI